MDEPTGNPVKYRISLNSGTITEQTARTFTPSSDLSDGSNRIDVQAENVVGNRSTWGRHIVTIDSTAPFAPQPSATTPTMNTTITWTWSACWFTG